MSFGLKRFSDGVVFFVLLLRSPSPFVAATAFAATAIAAADCYSCVVYTCYNQRLI